MQAIVGRDGLDRATASSSQMGRFETEWLATDANLEALADLSAAWIDRVHEYKPPDSIILDMDSSESPTHGEQEGSAWNGHFGCTCYHPLFVFNQFGDLETPVRKEFVNGEGFPYLGRSYRLLLVGEQNVPLKLTNGRFQLVRHGLGRERLYFVDVSPWRPATANEPD
jgi:hypothetical protein